MIFKMREKYGNSNGDHIHEEEGLSCMSSSFGKSFSLSFVWAGFDSCRLLEYSFLSNYVILQEKEKKERKEG